MIDEPALLAAVAATPDDDTTRLVTADRLDDHGRPSGPSSSAFPGGTPCQPPPAS